MPNELRKEENIHKTLEAGVRCFLRDGIERTQLLDVVAEAGVSKRSLLRYFKNKEKFVIAVLKFMGERQREYGCQLYYADLPKDCTGLEACKAYFAAVKQIFYEHPRYFSLLAEGELYLSHVQSQAAGVIDNYLGNFTASARSFQDLLEKGVKDGSITNLKNLDAKAGGVLCQSFFGMLIHLSLVYAMNIYSMEECVCIIDKYIDSIMRNLR